MGSESAAVGAPSAGGRSGVFPATPSPQPLQNVGVATAWHRVRNRSGSEARVQPGDHGSQYPRALWRLYLSPWAVSAVGVAGLQEPMPATCGDLGSGPDWPTPS